MDDRSYEDAEGPTKSPRLGDDERRGGSIDGGGPRGSWMSPGTDIRGGALLPTSCLRPWPRRGRPVIGGGGVGPVCRSTSTPLAEVDGAEGMTVYP
jgi:hypothetical protein